MELKWNAVEKRVSAMIAQGRFLTDEDRAAMPQYEKHQLARNIRTFFENVPQEQPHPYPFGFDYWDAVKLIEPQLDDPARVEEIYQMMVPIWEATPQDDRMYALRQQAFENLTAFRQGTFTLFAEHKEPAAPAMPQAKAYDLGYGHLGNGLTVWNRLEEEHGDYKTVAHIAPDRTVTIYDEEMPQAVREEIQRIADTSEMTISVTQDAPVFAVPPRVQEPPQKEEPADPYPELAAQVLRFVGEFDGSRMGYGEDDAQAVENIAQQLHDPVQREEIRRLLQSFLDHADPEEEIAVDITLCMEQIAELPPALHPGTGSFRGRQKNGSTSFVRRNMVQPILVIWKRWALPTPLSRMRKSPSRSMPIWSITALSVIWTGSFWSAGSMRAWMNSSKMSWPNWTLTTSFPFPMRSWNPSVPRRSRIRMTTAYSAA